jgi:hypothetical protein
MVWPAMGFLPSEVIRPVLTYAKARNFLADPRIIFGGCFRGECLCLSLSADAQGDSTRLSATSNWI